MSSSQEFVPPADPFALNNNNDQHTSIIIEETDSKAGLGSDRAMRNPVLQYFVDRNGCPCASPVASFFHLFFKITSLLVYLFANWFSGNFVFIFVVLVILLSLDFWTVKNITGRLMVGLRWWNEVQQDGSSQWKFESKEDRSAIDNMDFYIFWAALYVYPLAWCFMGIVVIWTFRLEWLMVIAMAVILSMTNVVGYTRCVNDAKGKVASYLFTQYVSSAMPTSFLSNAVSAITSRFSSR